MRHHPRAKEASRTAVDVVMRVAERRFPGLEAIAAKVGCSVEELRAWAELPEEARISEVFTLLAYSGLLLEARIDALPEPLFVSLPGDASPRRDYPGEPLADDPGRKLMIAGRSLVRLLVKLGIVTKEDVKDCYRELEDAFSMLDPPSG
jgi:hypothetical protein